MPLVKYGPVVKARIIQATLAARKAKKPWAEAFVGAKKVGYRGTQQGLEQMIRVATHKKLRRKRVVAAKRPKRGRPPKLAGVSSVETLIQKLVSGRVKVVLDKVIADLKKVRR